MDMNEARRVVVEVLHTIAPEVDLASLPGGGDLRDEADLDSMDLLNLMTGIQERTGVAIAERDVARLTTLDALVAHISATG